MFTTRRSTLILTFCCGMLTLLATTGGAAEYYVDSQAGAKGGPGTAAEPSASLSEVMDRLQPGDTVHLAGGIYREAETIRARGTAERPITIRPVRGQEPVIERTTWRLKHAQHVVLTGLTFRDCAPALEILDDASDNTIQGNRFLNCPPLAPEKLRQPTDWERAVWGQGPNAHRNRIIENEFKREYEGFYALNESLNVFEGNQYWVIRGNRIEGYMYGLQLGIGSRQSPPGFILVEDNLITNCNNGLHIKTGDNRIRGNHITDMRDGYRGYGTGIYLRSSPRTVVENNRIERGQWAGIRVLGGEHVLRNNIVTDTPVGVWLSSHSWGRASGTTWIVHNTIAGAVLPVWVESDRASALVHNNILAANGQKDEPATGIYAAGSADENPMQAWRRQHPLHERMYKRMAGNDDEPALVVANHNLYFNARPPADSPLNVNQRIDAGLDVQIDLAWWQGGNVIADPGFIDPEAGNWRLKPDSPARRAGRPLPNAAHDTDGVPRPDHPDLGAYQAPPPP